VLRKRDLQLAWNGLLPATLPVPKRAHTWWELREKFDEELDALKRNGPSIAWLETSKIGCEACRVAVQHAVLSEASLAQLSKLPRPAETAKAEASHNRTLTKILEHACAPDNFRAPRRAQGLSVKLKDASAGGSTWRQPNFGSWKLRPEMRAACSGLARQPRGGLISAATWVHAGLLRHGQHIALGTATGEPSDLLEIVASAEGRSVLAEATAAACHERTDPRTGAIDETKPSFCGKPPSIDEGDPCGVCGLVVGDLEHKVLRYDLGQGTAAGEMIGEELEAACEELPWRHNLTSSGVFTEVCEELVETKETELRKHLAGVVDAFAPSVSQDSIFATGICGKCKAEKTKKKGKNKKKKSKKESKSMIKAEKVTASSEL